MSEQSNTPTSSQEPQVEDPQPEPSQPEEPERKIGRVKWFGKGFGFIVDASDDSKQYFVHHTSLEINPDSEQQARIYIKYIMRIKR